MSGFFPVDIDQIITEGDVRVALNDRVIVFNKQVKAEATRVHLLPIDEAQPFLIADWNGLAGDFVLVPEDDQCVMGNAGQFVVASAGPGMGASALLIPVAKLNGWLVR